MREIKFRAFSKEQQKFFPFSFETMYGYEGETCGVLIRKDGSYNGVQINFNSGYGFDGMNPDIEITQYTGLKDKNGKEIYEGDIVRIPAFLPELNVVRFDRGAFCLQPVLHEGLDSNFWSDIKYAEEDRSEVIGNIYENPELINNKN